MALEALRDHRNAAALAFARQAYDLDPTDRAAKLLAVCHWLGGNAEKARELATRIPLSDAEREAARMVGDFEVSASRGVLGTGVWLVREGWTWFGPPDPLAPPCIIVEEEPESRGPQVWGSLAAAPPGSSTLDALNRSS
jgi:hypothetical protein